MKAMVLKGPNTPFELVELPDPVAGPGEAVARVITCGAGLDHPARQGRAAAGASSRASSATRSPARSSRSARACRPRRSAMRVTAYFYLNCGHCRWCLANLEPLCENTGGNVGSNCDGGYAEYIKLPAHIFIKLPDGLDYKAHPAEIGVITDALATPYKVLRRARVKAGRNRRRDRRRRRPRHPPGDDGEMGARPRDRRRHRGGQVRRLPQGRRRRGGRCVARATSSRRCSI